MKTCGNCIYLKDGKCEGPMPMWVREYIKNVVPHQSCSSCDLDDIAKNCETYKGKLPIIQTRLPTIPREMLEESGDE